jgi:hypothetical protein
MHLSLPALRLVCKAYLTTEPAQIVRPQACNLCSQLSGYLRLGEARHVRESQPFGSDGPQGYPFIQSITRCCQVYRSVRLGCIRTVECVCLREVLNGPIENWSTTISAPGNISWHRAHRPIRFHNVPWLAGPHPFTPSTVSFLQAAVYYTGDYNPGSFAVADLNGDHKIIGMNSNPSNLQQGYGFHGPFQFSDTNRDAIDSHAGSAASNSLSAFRARPGRRRSRRGVCSWR